MKTTFYHNGKKITRAKAVELTGEARLDRCIEESKLAFRDDPMEQNDYMVKDGILTICFE